MKTKGFTLVELLVVIAILAILATVSVVGYTTYIQNANQSKAVQELTQIRDYAMAYDLTHTGTGAKNGTVEAGEATEAISESGVDTNVVVLADGVVTYYSDSTKATVLAHWHIGTGKVVAGAHADNE